MSKKKITESWTKADLELYCKRSGYDINDFLEVNNILWSNGFDNWHLREQHAVPEILDFIKKKSASNRKGE